MSRDAPGGSGSRALGVLWRADVWLVLGAVAGAALAAAEIAGARGRVPADAVAVVAGTPVSQADYERELRTLSAERPGPLTPEERKATLDRLVDEELLIRRALALDLPRRDPHLRAEIVATAASDLVERQVTPEPTDDELRRFFQSRGGDPADLPAVRDAVRTEYLEHAARERLHASLAELRAEADVRLRPP